MLVDDFGIGLIHFWQHWCCSSRSFSGSNRGSLANSFCGFFLSQQAFLSILFFFCSLQDNSKHLSTNQQTNRQRSPVNCTTGICDMREVTAENFSYINKQVAVSSFVVGLHYRKPQKRILGTECCELRIFILNIMQNPMMN